jgi:hypothetical protein
MIAKSMSYHHDQIRRYRFWKIFAVKIQKNSFVIMRLLAFRSNTIISFKQ